MTYQPLSHKRIVEIIRKYSSNREDIRHIITSRINFPEVHAILDLGCGYGSFYEKINHPFSHAPEIVGIDRNEQNREYFLQNVAKCGGKGYFIHQELPDTIDFPPDSFDLILSIYSLYFFVGILPEIYRLLNKNGYFVAVTHCYDSFKEINALIKDTRLSLILKNFDDRNGKTVLCEYFREVNEIPYHNTLVFSKDGLEDLILYLQFKKPFWLTQEQEEIVEGFVLKQIAAENVFTITKDDMIYLCRK